MKGTKFSSTQLRKHLEPKYANGLDSDVALCGLVSNSIVNKMEPSSNERRAPGREETFLLQGTRMYLNKNQQGIFEPWLKNEWTCSAMHLLSGYVESKQVSAEIILLGRDVSRLGNKQRDMDIILQVELKLDATESLVLTVQQKPSSTCCNDSVGQEENDAIGVEDIDLHAEPQNDPADFMDEDGDIELPDLVLGGGGGGGGDEGDGDGDGNDNQDEDGRDEEAQVQDNDNDNKETEYVCYEYDDEFYWTVLRKGEDNDYYIAQHLDYLLCEEHYNYEYDSQWYVDYFRKPNEYSYPTQDDLVRSHELSLGVGLTMNDLGFPPYWRDEDTVDETGRPYWDSSSEVPWYEQIKQRDLQIAEQQRVEREIRVRRYAEALERMENEDIEARREEESEAKRKLKGKEKMDEYELEELVAPRDLQPGEGTSGTKHS